MIKRRIALLLSMLAVGLLSAAATASALTYEGAQAWSWINMSKHVNGYVMGNWQDDWCRGPYENIAYHTQWACYGNFVGPYTGCWWQDNVDPWGREVYVKTYCH